MLTLRVTLGESEEVAGVVNAMDGGKFAAVPLDLVDARRAKIEPVNGAERDAERAAQQDLYRADVTYHQDVLPAVVPQQPVTGAVYPAVRCRRSSPRPAGPARGRAARLPRLWASAPGFLPG